MPVIAVITPMPVPRPVIEVQWPTVMPVIAMVPAIVVRRLDGTLLRGLARAYAQRRRLRGQPHRSQGHEGSCWDDPSHSHCGLLCSGGVIWMANVVARRRFLESRAFATSRNALAKCSSFEVTRLVGLARPH